MIYRDETCRDLIDRALEHLSIVGRTLGPGGLPIIIERLNPPTPLTTKDGVTVAKAVQHPDRGVNTIIEAIKEVSVKTNQDAGDGTTTALVLTNALYQEAKKFMGTGADLPNRICESLTAAFHDAIRLLEASVMDIRDNREALRHVALISCNGDASIADMVVEAFDAVGEDGVIAVDEGYASEATLRIEEGYELPKGLDVFGPAAPVFINNPSMQESELLDAKLLLYGGKLSDVHQLAAAFENFGKQTMGGGREVMAMPPLAIIAYDFEGLAFQMLVENRRVGGLPILPIKLTSTGPRSQENVIQDLAVMTGGHAFFPGNKKMLAECQLEDLGRADRVVAGMRKTRIFGPHGDAEAILARVEVLKQQMEDAEYQYDKDNVRERIGKLVGGIAVIGVGGSSDLEMKERKHRVEDAIHATRAALEEGVIPGGGALLARVGQGLLDRQAEGSGYVILGRALQWPLRLIVSNVGGSPDVVLDRVTQGDVGNIVFDASTQTYAADAYAAGIIDPLKVVRSALHNACSIGRELIKAGGVVTFIKQPQLDDPHHNVDE